jgi:hypothetical protein
MASEDEEVLTAPESEDNESIDSPAENEAKSPELKARMRMQFSF